MLASGSATCLHFFYNMYGPSVGTLKVWIRQNIDSRQIALWALTGQQQQGWHEAKVPIPAQRDSFSVSDLSLDLIYMHTLMGIIHICVLVLLRLCSFEYCCADCFWSHSWSILEWKNCSWWHLLWQSFNLYKYDCLLFLCRDFCFCFKGLGNVTMYIIQIQIHMKFKHLQK